MMQLGLNVLFVAEFVVVLVSLNNISQSNCSCIFYSVDSVR
jgi:hypothetical protein